MPLEDPEAGEGGASGVAGGRVAIGAALTAGGSFVAVGIAAAPDGGAGVAVASSNSRPRDCTIGEALRGGSDESSCPVVRIKTNGVMKVPARNAITTSQILEADTVPSE
jgi:hypothetical protein